MKRGEYSEKVFMSSDKGRDRLIWRLKFLLDLDCVRNEKVGKGASLVSFLIWTTDGFVLTCCCFWGEQSRALLTSLSFFLLFFLFFFYFVFFFVSTSPLSLHRRT